MRPHRLCKVPFSIIFPQGRLDAPQSPELNQARPGLENTAPADVCDSLAARGRSAPRRRSKLAHPAPLGIAGALESAAGARSALLGRLKLTARACFAYLERSKLGRSRLVKITAFAGVSDFEPSLRPLETASASIGRSEVLPLLKLAARSWLAGGLAG